MLLSTGLLFTDAVTEEVAEGFGEATDKIFDLFQYVKDSIPSVIRFALLVILALIVFAIGKKIISVVVKLLRKSFDKSKLDDSVGRFLCSLISAVLHIVLILVIAEVLGFDTTSFAAIVASAGLAVGLSLQGSLANFAGGVLILVLKPFKLGDYISSGGVEGVVKHIDIFYTKIITVDNKVIVIPNGTLSNATITNVTDLEKRRVDLILNVAYKTDIDLVKKVLKEVAAKESLVLDNEPVDIFIDSFDDSAIKIGFRVWCNTGDYWTTKFNLSESIKKAFEANDIQVPFNQLDVHMIND